MKPEEIKVGDIYYCDLDDEKIRIDKIEGVDIYFTVIESSYKDNILSSDRADSSYINTWFELVYMVEGFEV